MEVRFTLRILIFAANFGTGMIVQRFKSFTVAVFSLFSILFSMSAIGQQQEGEKEQHATEKEGEGHGEKKEGFNAAEVIFGHVLNGHEFHFMDIGGKPVTIPLPVMLYSSQRGFTAFMSSKFEHGHADYEGYRMLNKHSIAEMKLDPKQFSDGDIIAINPSTGAYDASVSIYDISLTRNVVQMLLA